MFFFLSPSLPSGLMQAFDAAGWHAKNIPLNKRKHELFWFPGVDIYIYIVATFVKIWIGRFKIEAVYTAEKLNLYIY